MVVMAIACAELIEKICVHIAKRSFSLAVYVIWMMCNQMVLAAICSMAMMLVVEPSVTGKLVGPHDFDRMYVATAYGRGE